MKQKFAILTSVLFLSLLPPLFVGCSDPTLAEPETSLSLGPGAGEIITSAEVTFQWFGDAWTTEYSYQLDDAPWSEWLEVVSITFTGLSEGLHTFSVKSRYASEVEDATPATRTFLVDAVKGPALTVSPRHLEVASGSEFVVEVTAEEVRDLMLAHLLIKYDPTMLLLNQVETSWEENFLVVHGGTIVSVSEAFPDGTIDISLGTALSDPQGVDGSGPIAQLRFTALLPASTQIHVQDASELRNSQNQPIPINMTAHGLVVID